jgi:hypothetical protein
MSDGIMRVALPASRIGAMSQVSIQPRRCAMDNDNKTPAPEYVACEVCMKEVPKSIAEVPEGTDYVMYFCGLECHEKWKSQQEKPAPS